MKKLSNLEISNLLVSKEDFNSGYINDFYYGIKVNDGPAGLRMPTKEYPMGKPQFCMPCISILTSSFNPANMYKIGQCIASQCIKEDVDVILAPGINIKRVAGCGRNFEYFSEDPLLAGIMASEYVNGVQSLGIGTSLKHFCCNNREFDRLFQSSEVDYRTIREIYTKAFEIVIKNADPWTIMCSYNPINGINVAENKYILKDILRDKLHFNNVLISDWGAVHNRIDSLNASLDIQFPHSDESVSMIYNALENNKLDLNVVNQSIERITNLYNKINDNKHLRKALSYNQIEDIALECLCDSMVLLKNEDNILPLKGKNIALLGGLCAKPSYFGGGSASVYLDKPIPHLIDEMKKQMPDSNFEYSLMFSYNSCTVDLAFTQTMNLIDGYNKAKNADEVVIVVGTNNIIETESYDRMSLKLEQSIIDLINNVSKYNNNVVVVLEAGSVIDMTDWIDNVKAVLLAGFGGSVINKALSLILSGKVNPSGKLAETYPLSITDNKVNVDFGDGIHDYYNDTIFVGYRYYDYNNLNVAFPFGFGLSYSDFEYNNFAINKLDDSSYEISLDVTNIGDYKGKEVVQLYFSSLDSKVIKPKQELLAFKKIELESKETKTVKFIINKIDLSYFDVTLDDWNVDSGTYEIKVAKHSRDIVKSFKIII